MLLLFSVRAGGMGSGGDSAILLVNGGSIPRISENQYNNLRKHVRQNIFLLPIYGRIQLHDGP